MAHDIAILTEKELRTLVQLDLQTVKVVENAFRELASGLVVMPPILSMKISEANGEVDIKTAYVPSFDSFAIKVSPGFFDNPKLGLPSLNGMMVLLSTKTGLVEAVLLDNGYLTDIRTAAAGAVAAKHLARKQATTAGVFGTGAQARLQMQAVRLVRPIERVLVWGRDPEKARACAADVADATGVAAGAEADPARLMSESQIVVTATSTHAPILRAAWLQPGLHITAVGADQAEKNELEPAVLTAADVYACDRVSQCERLGELRTARAAGLMIGTPPELGDIVAGKETGRASEDAVTICDLTGTGAQDTAIANCAYRAALAAGVGARIST